MKNSLRYLTSLLFLLVYTVLSAQAGLGVTPPRNYYSSAPGVTTVNKITVSNPSKNNSLQLTISFNDWEYNAAGQNVIVEPGTLSNSCAAWITVKPGSYLNLAPGESQELEVSVTPPANLKDGIPVHTALMFLTQTNSMETRNEQGALVKVSLRSGVKIYHHSGHSENPDLDFSDYRFNTTSKNLDLIVENSGNIWTDARVSTELVNQKDGTRQVMAEQFVYTLPGDKRSINLTLPEKLKPGKYLATSTLSYGEEDVIKMAELSFVYE